MLYSAQIAYRDLNAKDRALSTKKANISNKIIFTG